MIIIKIETENAAFEAPDKDHEAARILRKLADRLDRHDWPVSLYDINGNNVGTVEEKEYE
ncbi:hypothetical protein FP828_03680 [bacterium]|nr:hypothetical protein [Candidatus Omnitrophota bacterium]MBA3065573.1 hypothetical protein [bacterium]